MTEKAVKVKLPVSIYVVLVLTVIANIVATFFILNFFM
jgi:hypothetical protein